MSKRLPHASTGDAEQRPNLPLAPVVALSMCSPFLVRRPKRQCPSTQKVFVRIPTRTSLWCGVSQCAGTPDQIVVVAYTDFFQPAAHMIYSPLAQTLRSRFL